MTKVRVGGKSTVKERGTFRPGVLEIIAGTNVTVDSSDPTKPIVSATGGGGGGAVDSVNGQTGVVVLNAANVGADAAGSAAAALSSANAYTDNKVLDSIVYAVALG